MRYYHGFIPFGAQDDAILLQHDFCSDPTSYLQSLGTVVVQGSGLQTFDARLGMAVNGSGGFRLQNMTGYAQLDSAFQLQFKVPRAFVCNQDANNYSFGYLPSSAEYALSLLGSAAANFGQKAATGQFSLSFGGGAISQYLASGGKDEFVTVGVSCNGGKVGGTLTYAIDGVPVRTAARNSQALANMFQLIYFGSDRGSANTFMRAPYTLKDVLIAARPAMFPVHPALRSLVVLSDSLFNTDDLQNGSYRDVVTSWSLRRALASYGLYAGAVTVTTNGGARLDDSGTAGAGTGDRLWDDFNAYTLTAKPSVVVFRGGTNDAGGGRCSQPGWQADVARYITAALALPSTKIVVLTTIPSRAVETGNPNYAEVQTGNTKIKAAVDAWRAANPSDPRQVVVADAYAELGGESPAPGTFIGQVQGSQDIHLSGYGHYVHGRCIAEAIVRAIGNQ